MPLILDHMLMLLVHGKLQFRVLLEHSISEAEEAGSLLTIL